MSSKMADKKHAAASTSYRDDPDADALSMHTTRSDYDYDDVPELPSYSDVEAAEDQEAADLRDPPPQDEYRSIPFPAQRKNWHSFKKAQSKGPSAAVGEETSIRMDENLMDQEKLYDYITKYLRYVPSRPYVRIHGWHWETERRWDAQKKESREETTRKDDFDVFMNLQGYLPGHGLEGKRWVIDTEVSNGQKALRGGWRKTRMRGYSQDIEVGEEETPSLKDWCEDFCVEKKGWPLRIFRIERSVVGLDEAYLKENLETLVRSTQYRGHVDITFPVGDRNVDIYSPHWINRWRISWIRYIFYLTFLWIITWPLLFFLTKRWSVYSVNWNFSQCRQSAPNEQGEVRMHRQYATLSEKKWIERHANLLRNLVLEKFHGEGTDLPADVEVRERGMESEALRFTRQAIGLWNTARGVERGRVSGADAVGWGGDER